MKNSAGAWPHILTNTLAGDIRLNRSGATTDIILRVLCCSTELVIICGADFFVQEVYAAYSNFVS